MKTTPTPILVLGCPRSGTSAFANWLATIGLRTVEDPRRRAGYPAGYYEHLPIAMFHRAVERVLRRTDQAIRLEPYLTESLLRDPYVRTMYEEAFAPVERDKVAFLKYPQLALSIEFLLSRYPTGHVIGVWRGPEATFRSLVKREFTRELALTSGVRSVLLWSLYAYHLVGAKSKYPERVTIVRIEDFFRRRELRQRLLRKLAIDPGAAEAGGLDERRWVRRPSLAWQLYYRMAVLVAEAVLRFGDARRRELRNHKLWYARLCEVTDNGRECIGTAQETLKEPPL